MAPSRMFPSRVAAHRSFGMWQTGGTFGSRLIAIENGKRSARPALTDFGNVPRVRHPTPATRPPSCRALRSVVDTRTGDARSNRSLVSCFTTRTIPSGHRREVRASLHRAHKPWAHPKNKTAPPEKAGAAPKPNQLSSTVLRTVALGGNTPYSDRRDHYTYDDGDIIPGAVAGWAATYGTDRAERCPGGCRRRDGLWPLERHGE